MPYTHPVTCPKDSCIITVIVIAAVGEGAAIKNSKQSPSLLQICLMAV